MLMIDEDHTPDLAALFRLPDGMPTHDDKCERCGECLGCCWASVSHGVKAYTWCIVRDGPRRKHRWPLDTAIEDRAEDDD